jgi:hypothetical protein
MAEGLGWDQKHFDGDVDYGRFLPFWLLALYVYFSPLLLGAVYSGGRREIEHSFEYSSKVSLNL